MGKFFDEFFVEIGLSRDEVYIINIVKCCLLENCDFIEEEIKVCFFYFDR